MHVSTYARMYVCVYIRVYVCMNICVILTSFIVETICSLGAITRQGLINNYSEDKKCLYLFTNPPLVDVSYLSVDRAGRRLLLILRMFYDCCEVHIL